MEGSQIYKACRAAMASDFIEKPRDARVTLVVPGEPRGLKKKLYLRKGPLGDVLNVQDGRTVASFNAYEVICFLQRNGIKENG